MVRTKTNTDFSTWWKLTIEEFERRGLPAPGFGEADGADKMGESPETWADFVANS